MMKATSIGSAVAAVCLGLFLSAGSAAPGAEDSPLRSSTERPAIGPVCTGWCAHFSQEGRSSRKAPLAARTALGGRRSPSAEPARRLAEGPTKTVYQPGEVYRAHSRIYVFVGKTGLGHEHGVEGKLASGSLVLGGEKPSGELVFDMTSFTADTKAARNYVGLEGTVDAGTRRKVDANMLGADVLNVRRFPQAKFVVSGVSPMKEKSRSGHPQYRIDGKFTLHGRTRNVRLIAEAVSKKDWTHVRGRFTILQSDYGITPFSKAFGAIGVADRLTIWGDLWVANKRLVVGAARKARTQ